ncbi:hypothetical protein DHEL01_v205025 [Diaporthe helianthi]|uniref:Uncharacterized protein n=1 Tax=Diaporthe helianthi TaxID=158607 RepID=A0A2P5I277_DIAHE|nr:hypothetical protein DHEL01_v205025 [Diaporthe helianthi]
MQSLVTVNNNVSLSLVSVTIAPSTALAIFTIALVFLALYLPPLPFRSARSSDKAISPSKHKYYDDIATHPTDQYGSRFASYFDYSNTWWYPHWNRNGAPDPIELRNHPPLTEGLPQPRATLALEDGRRRSGTGSRIILRATRRTKAGESDRVKENKPKNSRATHSGFLRSDTEEDLSEMENSMASGGGYSPPAWRRLGNGDKSIGFWRSGDNFLGYGGLPPPRFRSRSRESSPEYDSMDEDYDDEETLAAAIRTRLPTGSLSPEKERSPEPEYMKHPFHSKAANKIGHGNGNADATTNGEVRIKSEEPSAEEMKARLATLPQKDDPENCMFP